ncbi:MAG TPA: hypothetical protein VEX36_08405 [Thermoleophilaceae bacterium]|nr:hypothetical protein [Thermoleophilaceae bacterium]
MTIAVKSATFESAAAGGTGADGYDSKLEAGGGAVQVVDCATEGIPVPPWGGTDVAKQSVPAAASTRNARGVFSTSVAQGDNQWMSFGIYIPPGFWAALTANLTLARLTGSGQHTYFTLNSTAKRLSVEHYDDTTTTRLGPPNATDNHALEEGRWHLVELRALYHATPGTARTELWINGQRKYVDSTRKNLTVSGSTMTEFQTFVSVQAGNAHAITLYFDVVKLGGAQQAPANRAYPFGFEDGRLQSVDGHTTQNANLTVDDVNAGGRAYDGRYSAKMTTTTTTGGAFGRPWVNTWWDVGDIVWYGAAVWIPGTALPSDEIELLRWDTSLVTGSGTWDVGGIHLQSDDHVYLYRQLNGAARVELIDGGVLPRDQHVWLEARQVLGSSAGAPTYNELLVNGASVGISTAANKGAVGRQISTIRAFANVSQSGSPPTFSAWTDRIRVDKVGTVAVGDAPLGPI